MMKLKKAKFNQEFNSKNLNPTAIDFTFGPVPSRRLGRSLGINNIPPKTCSYACVYCQLGNTNQMRIKRREFYPLQNIIKAVGNRIRRLEKSREDINYLAFVPDGEPTLDRNLGKTITQLRVFDIPIAVITNASLIEDPYVQEALCLADWVSLKVDSVNDQTWRSVDRPYRRLNITTIMKGIIEFSGAFTGDLITETMLVKNINDDEEQIRNIAEFLALFNPQIAYLAIPIRPPAEAGVQCPAEPALNRAFQIFDERLTQVELLNNYEGNAFSITGNPEKDILSISAVHPIREDALIDLLKRNKSDWAVVDFLIQQGKLKKTEYKGHIYFLRKTNS